jgi:hypothetical protein
VKIPAAAAAMPTPRNAAGAGRPMRDRDRHDDERREGEEIREEVGVCAHGLSVADQTSRRTDLSLLLARSTI